MRYSLHISLHIAIGALVAIPSAAQADKFRYSYKPGQVIQSRAGMAGASIVGPTGGDQARMQFRVSMRQTVRVLSVANGIATLEVTDTPISGKMTSMGRTQPYDQQPTKSIVRITERGRFLSRKELAPARAGVEAEGDAGDGMEGADVLFGLNFPDRNIKPGESWQDTLVVGGPRNRTRVRLNCRYVGTETVLGRRCAKFTATVTSEDPEGDGPPPIAGVETQTRFQATTTTYFDPAAGVEVYSSGWITNTMRTDFSGLSPEGGELVSVTKINLVQYLAPNGRKEKP